MSAIAVTPLVCGAFQVNSYLLNRTGRSDALLIDAGDDADLLIGSIERAGIRLTDILLTHGHFDHTMALHRLVEATGARVHIHPCDAAMLRDSTAACYVSMAVSGPFEPVEDYVPFEIAERAELELCGILLTILHTPGHTPGSVSFAVGEEIVFTGDTLFVGGVGRTDLPGGDMVELRHSLMTLLALPPQMIAYPGHGGFATIGEIREDFL